MTQARLRILGTTDLHMQLTGSGRMSRGLTHLATHIEALRNDGIETVLLDNGDFMQGTPLADHLVHNRDGPHPMAQAMNALRYDAVGLGNHEFNYGISPLRQVIDDFDMPVVCANVRTGPDTTLTDPWTLIERTLICDDGTERTLKIGIVGFVPPQIVDWDYPRLKGEVESDDIIAAALTHTPAMMRAGADMIVALCHSGIGEAEHKNRMENAALPLAGLRTINVLLAGHTHDQFPGPFPSKSSKVDAVRGALHGKPTVMAGFSGSHLGVIDLTLTWEGDTCQIASFKSTLKAATEVAPQPEFDAMLQKRLAVPRERTAARMGEPVARTTASMNSFFTSIGIDPSLDLFAAVHLDAARPFLEASSYGALPVIAAVTSFRAGGRSGPENYLAMSKGAIRRGDVLSICPFHNTLCVLVRRGWQLRKWLNHGARFFNRIHAGRADQSLINPDFPAYHFDRLIGLDYTYDLGQPVQSDPLDSNGRLGDMMYQGRKLEDDDLCVVVTNSFRANGGGGGLGPLAFGDILYSSEATLEVLVSDYLRARETFTPKPKSHFSFAPMAETSVIFPSSPLATQEDAPPGIKALGIQETGFSHFKLTL